MDIIHAKRVDLLKICKDNKKFYKGYSKCKNKQELKEFNEYKLVKHYYKKFNIHLRLLNKNKKKYFEW